MKDINKNIIVYLTNDKKKNKAIKKYCKANNLNVLAVVKPNFDTIGDSWDSGIYKLYDVCANLSRKDYISNILTYSLDDLDYGIDSQVSICHYLLQAGAFVDTLKEGEFFFEFNFNCSFESELTEENVEFLKQYWIDEDKQNYRGFKNEKTE